MRRRTLCRMAPTREVRESRRRIGSVAVIAAVALAGCGSAAGPVTVTPAPMAPDATEDLGAGDTARPADDTAWWRMRFNPVQAIEVGTLGAGGVATVQLVQQRVFSEALVFPMREVIGPRNGLVVTIGGDGGTGAPEAVITAIDATSGEQREVLRTPDVVLDAVFATGTTVVFLTADSRTGALTGTWRVDAAAPARAEPVEGLLGEAPDIQLVARKAPSTQLFTSPTGELVAVLRCTAAGACGVRAVDLVDGTAYEQPLAQGDQLIGLAGERALIQPMCMAEFCAGELLDLASGERAEIPHAGRRPIFGQAVIASADGPVLITQVTGNTMPGQGATEQPSFLVTDLEGLRTGGPVAVDLGSMTMVPAWMFEFGVELPPGWFAVMGAPPAGDGAGAASRIIAVSASDGEVVPLPVLGEFMIQG